MRNTKKIIAAAMAGIMVLAQSVMAFAATEGGFDANVDTEKAVLRVSVPTSMDIMVDQFEIGEEGVQINSDAFEMTNYSQMAVKINVTSTVTLKDGVSLVDTKAGAVESEGSEAWLAVAAATEANTFGDGIANLDDEDVNVDTFSSSNTAFQNFYLSKGTEAVVYTLMIPAKDAEPTPGTYLAEYYELTEAASVTDQDTLDAALAASDLYTTATAAVDGDTVTLLEKDSSQTYSSSVTYYTMDVKPTADADLLESSLYAFGATTNAGASAEFKYLGRLSDAKESWTNEDITGISVAYTITGVTSTIYDAVENDLVYGYLNGKTASDEEQTPSANPTVTAQDDEITWADTSKDLVIDVAMSGKTVADVGFIVGDVTYDCEGTWATVANTDLDTLGFASYTANTVTLDSTVLGALTSPHTIFLSLSDGSVVTFTVTFSANPKVTAQDAAITWADTSNDLVVDIAIAGKTVEDIGFIVGDVTYDCEGTWATASNTDLDTLGYASYTANTITLDATVLPALTSPHTIFLSMSDASVVTFTVAFSN